MALPGWGTVAGVAAKILDKFIDPRRKKEALLNEKESILSRPQTTDLARRLQSIDEQLLRVQREIDRSSD